MLQLRRRLDLGQESFRTECNAEVFVQDLDRDVSVVAEIVREIYCRHAARADLSLDAVPVCNGATDVVEDVHRRTPEGGPEQAGPEESRQACDTSLASASARPIAGTSRE